MGVERLTTHMQKLSTSEQQGLSQGSGQLSTGGILPPSSPQVNLYSGSMIFFTYIIYRLGSLSE
jgi:hypothetical protein